MFFLAVIITLSLVTRLGWIQLVVAEELYQKAWEQWNKNIPTTSTRGEIFDRHGNLLAGSRTVETVAAIPPHIDDPHMTARALAPILDTGEERLHEQITQVNRWLVYLKRKVDESVADEVRLLNLPGITFTYEDKRYYPNETLLSQLVGFVGLDQGWGGLEVYYEEALRGSDGTIVVPTDARGREVPGVRRFVPSQEGKDLVLTIDETIQFIVERELSRALMEYDASRVMALAVNPNTGEILAASSKPDFDPNRYSDYDSSCWRLYPVTDTFEPGSTFKLVTLCAAVEEGLYREEESFHCSGSVKVANRNIRCWTSDKGGHGTIDFMGAVKYSCNPAFIALGERLGAQRLFEYIRAFGFGNQTGVDYPGEGSGIVFNLDQVGPVELATTSFGQGISTTPLQQAMAVSAMANGGYLMSPYLVKEIRGEDGTVVEKREPEVIRQVISSDTSETVKRSMEEVVKSGSGVNASIDGYRIAGKTGTAQKVGPGGNYIRGEYILSFVGFAPLEDPQVVLYVAVDGARRGPQWGSQVSAPLFRNIMVDVLSYLEIPPSHLLEEEPKTISVPELEGLSVDEASVRLDAEGLLLKPVGEEGAIRAQFPGAGSEVPLRSGIIVYLEGIWGSAEGEVVLPDLTGMTIKEVAEVLSYLGLKMEAEGSGMAVEQDPTPREVLEKNSTVSVRFSSPYQ